MRIKDDSFVPPRPRRRRRLKTARKTRDAALRTWDMIVLHTVEGKSPRQIAEVLDTNVATVKRTRSHWRKGGRRCGSIDAKATSPRPRSTVGCPRSKRANNKRTRLDAAGHPARVPAPGKNVKRYVAGVMDAQTDRLTWVRGVRSTQRSPTGARP